MMLNREEQAAVEHLFRYNGGYDTFDDFVAGAYRAHNKIYLEIENGAVIWTISQYGEISGGYENV